MTSVTELDFNDIKTSLKNYLKNQNRFLDYDFEGSNINILLDILAYNTYQNNFYTNMAMSEMFLDSAQLRDSVISHAKELNYTPRSKTSARAKVNLALTVAAPYPATVTIPAKTKFIARCGNRTFAFYNETAEIITPTNNRFEFFGLDIYEGRYITEAFQVTGNDGQRYILSNADVDTDSIKVTVKQTSTDTTSVEYIYKQNIFGVTDTDPVFYIQPAADDKYEITFGLNRFGLAPSTGNVIIVEYRITAGTEANGVTSFAAESPISGYATAVTLNAKSSGASDAEDIESIRYFAPKSIQVQDRAVTESDYEILLKNRFPEIQAVSVYGGEEATPPQYGRVIIAVDVQNASGVSENDKTKYYNYLKDRTPIGIEPIIVSPEFMYLDVNTQVNYNISITDQSPPQIRTKVLNSIVNYSNQNLSDFKKTFRGSKFAYAIDNSDPSIVSNETEILAIIPLNPILNVNNSYDFSFRNKLIIDHKLTDDELISSHKSAIKSSTFTYNGSNAFIIDNGLGVLQIIRTTSSGFVYLNRNIGSVNYDTGRVIITNLNLSAYGGSELKIYARTDIQDITAPKTRIITIREEDIRLNVVGVKE